MRIRKVTTDGLLVDVAGVGAGGNDGDGDPLTKRINYPHDLVVSPTGFMIFSKLCN